MAEWIVLDGARTWGRSPCTLVMGHQGQTGAPSLSESQLYLPRAILPLTCLWKWGLPHSKSSHSAQNMSAFHPLL